MLTINAACKCFVISLATRSVVVVGGSRAELFHTAGPWTVERTQSTFYKHPQPKSIQKQLKTQAHEHGLALVAAAHAPPAADELATRQVQLHRL